MFRTYISPSPSTLASEKNTNETAVGCCAHNNLLDQWHWTCSWAIAHLFPQVKKSAYFGRSWSKNLLDVTILNIANNLNPTQNVCRPETALFTPKRGRNLSMMLTSYTGDNCSYTQWKLHGSKCWTDSLIMEIHARIVYIHPGLLVEVTLPGFSHWLNKANDGRGSIAFCKQQPLCESWLRFLVHTRVFDDS